MSTEMEHTNEQNQNTERYLLNEMAPEESASFEEHFFSCQICGEDVAAAARLFAAGHEVAVDEKRNNVKPIRRETTVWQWLPQALAASVVTAILTWFAVPRPGVITAVPQEELITTVVRGPEQNPKQVSVPCNLVFEIPPAPGATAYHYTVRDAKGTTLTERHVPLEEAADKSASVQLTRELPRGRYEVVIESVRKDGNRSPVTRTPFEVVGER